jgi:excisionase family DNA binding protein
MSGKENRPQTIDGLMTDKEVAELLGVSRTSVWKYVLAGQIPKPIKFGRMSRFPVSEISKAIETAKRQRAA